MNAILIDRQVRQVAAKPPALQQPAPRAVVLTTDSAEQHLAATRYLDTEALFLGANGYRLDYTALPPIRATSRTMHDLAESIRTRFVEAWSETRFWGLPDYAHAKGQVAADELQAGQDDLLRTILAHIHANWWVERRYLSPTDGPRHASPWLCCRSCGAGLGAAEYRLMRAAKRCSHCPNEEIDCA